MSKGKNRTGEGERDTVRSVSHQMEDEDEAEAVGNRREQNREQCRV